MTYVDKILPIPWLPYLATEYIRKLNPDFVFEWGSGGSSLFFTDELHVDTLVSVEHDAVWWEKVHPLIPYYHDHLLIPYEIPELGSDPANPMHYKSASTELGPVNFKKYASAIDWCGYGPFDLILIDGMARASCLYHAISHVKPGGCIVLDNVGDRPYYLAQTDYLFGNYESGWERIVFSGYGPILDYQWSTLILKNTKKADYE